MILLLLLCAPLCTGSTDYYKKEYGSSHRMRLHRKTYSITFTRSYSSGEVVLWRLDQRPPSEDGRLTVTGLYFIIRNLTQRDSGHYYMKDHDKETLSTSAIVVSENTRSLTMNPGQRFNVSFPLEPTSCNIYFYPEDDYELIETRSKIVHKGKLQNNIDTFTCRWFRLLKPCEILIDSLQEACSGNFEVRDQNGDKALVVSLQIERLTDDEEPSYGITFAVFAAGCLCCLCMKLCCCKGSSSKQTNSETASAESAELPSPQYWQYDHQPAAPRRSPVHQPSGQHYSAQSSCAAADPLIHNPPTVTVTPAYSEVSTPAKQEPAPTVLICSDPEPRFELKGMTTPLGSLLTSTSTYCDVYTSDKLNAF
ncbi:uncharacterized protein LOC115049873 [Echeneis naucrates]|uniref:uncharacterized protein LOC115049873 n=1 Tax=Echeneis naucrates TaxID=173247 RepID=UPI0011146571|nr:uncharacterized protein LOC115049873 [Echeneis naucrates]